MADINKEEITEAYFQNLKDSEEEKQKYEEAYPKALRIYDNLVNNITEDEALQIVDILKSGSEEDKLRLAEGIIELFNQNDNSK